MDIKELRMGSAIEQGVVHMITYQEGILGVYVLDSSFMSMVTQPFIPIDECIPLPLSSKHFYQNNFSEQISFHKTIRGEKFKNGGVSISVMENDLDTWYVHFREFNEGEPDDLVTLKSDIRYAHEFQNLYYDLTEEDFFIK